MLLDLEDEQIRASIKRLSGNRVRLILDYPREDRYRDQVMEALANLLRPSSANTNRQQEELHPGEVSL